MASVPHIRLDAVAPLASLEWRSVLARVRRSSEVHRSPVAAKRARETDEIVAVPTPYATRIAELRRQIATDTYLTDEKIDVVVDRLLGVLRRPDIHAPRE